MPHKSDNFHIFLRKLTFWWNFLVTTVIYTVTSKIILHFLRIFAKTEIHWIIEIKRLVVRRRPFGAPFTASRSMHLLSLKNGWSTSIPI